ncbi:candidapepsin-4 precursor [Aaosphaeria arxii CBS 175.79]|uniref:Probable aspartic-type endopeptidase OPSB n=1 Tax=Aaosphaeria arxii CBS 175.79 TaxID=1450172 RepID=A0A6A5XVE4_9PLEO|nr:candidapepsin-4 precursor [Aaosphaeria arxii CBS 175.79]KAF2016600.1 candidapepsin-4 precursor [Aaosphaeria arxii CBS 175.79]
MKYSALIFAVELFASVEGFKLVARENPRVLGLDIQRRHVSNPLHHDRLRRRQKTVQQTLDNLETLYFANASLGTPAQDLRLHIDTGSSDLWANAASSQLCTSRGNPCSESGTYDANSSSTYEYVNSVFNISYVDGSGAVGDYAKDNFNFGGKTVQGLQFGIGYDSSSAEGILGIGYTTNEVQVNRAGLQAYPNLPQALADSGDINTNAYSLWLNDLDASTGNILFGGVDTDKYEGTLGRLPIIQERGGIYAEFIIALTGLGQNGKAGSLFQNQAIPVLLDSGSSLMYLPNSIANSLYTAFNAQYDQRQGAAIVDCNLANQEGSLDFTFSGPTISVPLNELVITIGYQRGEPVCILGIGPADNSLCVLGDTFLRSAYVVYDLDNNEIALAQTKFNVSQSSIKEIQSGDDGIPQASLVPNAVSSVAVGTGGGRIAGPTINPTGASRPSSTGAAMPIATANPWLGAGAVVAGAGIMMGFNGL